MPRWVVIAILVVLIVGVVGGTAALLVQRFRSGQEVTDQGQETGGPGGLLPGAEDGVVPIENPDGDDDGDGLPNAQEAIWGTDINNPDTDGDGVFDGEEVKLNRNPTIAAPGDELPENFQPQRDLTPLQDAPLRSDDFFVEGVDLDLEDKNYTSEYESEYAGDERNADTLNQYIFEQKVAFDLPEILTSRINVQTSGDLLAIGVYLDEIRNGNPLLDEAYFKLVLNELIDSDNTDAVQGAVDRVAFYRQELEEIATPETAIELQRLLLGYAEFMEASLQAVLEWPEDRVKALVAIRQLDEGALFYPALIADEMRRLKFEAGLL